MSRDWKNKKVVVLYGGQSSERQISLKTGGAFIDALGRLGIPHVALDFHPRDIQALIDEKPDCALIAMHGRLGEGGPVQGILEFLRIPYTGSGLLSSALAIDKIVSKELLDSVAVATPEWWAPVRREDAAGIPDEFPLVVKPAEEGSSVGVSKVTGREELDGAVHALVADGTKVLVERCIDGAELSVAIMDGEVLGTVEIEVSAGFYDFSAKYERGDTTYHIPPRLDAAALERVEAVALKAWQVLRCRGVGRVDVMLDRAGKPWVLEANTVPGMTPTSLVPKLALARGYAFDDFVVRMLNAARLDGGAR